MRLVRTEVDAGEGEQDFGARGVFDQDDIEEAIVHAGVGRDAHAAAEAAAVGDGREPEFSLAPQTAIHLDAHGLWTAAQERAECEPGVGPGAFTRQGVGAAGDFSADAGAGDAQKAGVAAVEQGFGQIYRAGLRADELTGGRGQG